MTIQLCEETMLHRDEQPRILKAKRFDESVLGNALNGQAAVVRIPGMIPELEGRRMANELAQLAEFIGDGHVKQIGRLGLSFQQTASNQLLRDQYFCMAAVWEEILRVVAAPLPSPASFIVSQLQQNWRHGATRECVTGKPMFAGAVRVFGDTEGALPHQDILARDVELGNTRANSLVRQLAITLYLTSSEEGGELELWPQKPSQDEFEKIRVPGSWDIDRSQLDEPLIVISPQPGELVIYDAGYVHAARPTRGGLRVTVSLFVGYRGPNEPITFWS